MLYELDKTRQDLTPVSFFDISDIGGTEKELEALLAKHLLDVLFEDEPLMPIFQERPMQPEADLYALDSYGNLVIFELKKGVADSGAMHQLIRYAQEAGQWTFNKLESKYRTYKNDPSASLINDHQKDFELESSLRPSGFNTKQHLRIVGYAADNDLIGAVRYWKQQGLSIDFLPYRIFSIDGKNYFEFFTHPYDQHRNPSKPKGVLFDTNDSSDPDDIWKMMIEKRASAYGGVAHVVDQFNRGDIVFFSHKGYGLVAAARVAAKARNGKPGSDERYCEVVFLTPTPSESVGFPGSKFMPFADVVAVTGKKFYWNATMKRPFLNLNEADLLLQTLNTVLK